MGLGGVAIAVPPYVIHPKTAVLGRAGGENRPTIGNNVTIHCNSVIVGNIIIGNNVVIGAGTVLTKSVPDNCVVVGNPAFILRENGNKVNKKL